MLQETIEFVQSKLN